MCQYTTFLFLIGILVIILIWFDYTRTKKSYKYEKFTSNPINELSKPIQIIDNFLSPIQIQDLLELANSRYTNSTVYTTNHGSIDKTSRSSSCAYFKRGENDLIKSIESTVSKIFSIDLENIEPLQIARYEKGQEYKYHYDYFGSETDQKKNQRMYSILVYLNDLNELDGGATHFPLYKIRTYPYKGRAITWNNLNPDGKENTLTLHAGEPILTDKVKYVLTIWTRVSEY